jgi:hypothetical protein
MGLPAVEDIGRGLSAALRLMTDGAKSAPRIAAGWRELGSSFWAILISLPADICLLAANNAASGLPLSIGISLSPSLIPLTALQHLAPFILPPLFVLALTRRLAPQRFAPFLVGWNWAQAIVTMMMAVPALLLAAGLSNPGIALLQCLAVVALSARLRYAMIRTTLDAPPAYARLLVAIFMLGDLAIARMIGSPIF